MKKHQKMCKKIHHHIDLESVAFLIAVARQELPLITSKLDKKQHKIRLND
jgi:hypothetical protein